MEADIVIVGAGSAGSALAYRLSDAGLSVIVIEYGGTDAGPFIQMPGALSYPMNMARYDWGLVSEPEPNLNNRRMAVPRGKVIGGSSSINGMVYVRGHAHDFDCWAEAGASGWGFADVLPYFKRMETWHGADASEWRGQNGPLHVTRGRQANPLFHAFVEAGRQAGYGITEDYNGQRQEGFGAMEATIWKGRRWSAANAYLKPALRRPNCTLLRAFANRVVVENGRAVGVEVSKGDKTQLIRARREVVLAASSINTPKILMLSGIGPGPELARHNIPVAAERPGVGANLQDHLEVYVQFAAKQPITLYRYWNLFGKAWVGARWLWNRSGPGASNQFESTGFIRSAAGIEYPDIQFHFLPLAVRYDGKTAIKGHGFQAHVGPMRSKSRGTVTLRSADPKQSPAIQFNYMSHPDDWTEFRRCLQLTREIFTQPAMKEHVAEELTPGADIQSEEEMDGFVRAHAESAYHPCGTAKIGRRDDPMAVVDPDCRVIGVEGLRVADSSVFPQITNGNLNAPSIMVGEKVADHILDRRLAPENLEPWLHSDWQNSQR